MLVAVCLGMLVAACTTQTNYHGHRFTDADIQQIQPGMSQDAVKLALGTPDTTSTVDGQVYYYISSRTEAVAFMSPTVVERRVVAVYFNPLGSVERVAHYGMEDGRVIDFISRRTPTAKGEKGILQKLFKGIGKKQVFDNSDS